MDFKKTIKAALPMAAVSLGLGLSVIPAQAGALYSDIPTVDVNLGHENTSYAGAPANSGVTSFGSLIRPATGYLYYVTAALSNYATQAMYVGQGNSTGYDVSLSLDLYDANSVASPGTGNNDVTYTLGTAFATSNSTAHIAWRPSASSGGGSCLGVNENEYIDGSGQSCGQLNMVNFDFGSNPYLNGDVIWKLTILNKTAGPAASLNWALSDGSFTAVEGDTGNFTSTSNPQFATNYVNGAGTTGWSTFGQGEVMFGTPEPATFGLIGLGLLGVGVVVRRKRV